MDVNPNSLSTTTPSQNWSEHDLWNEVSPDLGLILIFVWKDLQCSRKSSTMHCFYTFTADLQSRVEWLSNRKLLYVIAEGVGSLLLEAATDCVSQYFKPLQVESDQLRLLLLFDIISVFSIP